MSSARTRGTTPDLFSHTTSVSEPSSPSQNQPSSSHVVAKGVNNLTSPRHVLPKSLAAAVKQLGDAELDQLLSAALDEKKRRGQKPSDQRLRKRQAEAPSIPLTRGQINAVQAAFRAGVTPTRIARQFGLSQSDVRKALVSDMKK
jgi:DNA invertase Pin-like site-specific DNA recombinase